MSAAIRVILADDHVVVRSGLRRLLEQSGGLEVVAEASSGEQAYQLCGAHAPDVLVLDMSMPGIGGLEALRRIIARYPASRVVIYSMHENAAFATQALAAGACAYVPKSGAADDLVRAVREAAEGRSYLSASIRQKIASQASAEQESPLTRLSAREFEIFRLLAEGHALAAIADMLNVSQKTVANHQTLLKQKLGISRPAELVRLAIRHGIIDG